MEKGQGKGTDTLQTDNVFTRKKYIEREAALESLCVGCEYVPIDEKENCPYRFTGCQEYANIFSIPAADVVPVRTAVWIPIPGDGITFACSKCKYMVMSEHGGTNYCPNCGARMDGDGDA